MNTYYKLALLYICIGAFFTVVGFYTTHLDRDLSSFYKHPYLVEKDNEDAPQDGEIA